MTIPHEDLLRVVDLLPIGVMIFAPDGTPSGEAPVQPRKNFRVLYEFLRNGVVDRRSAGYTAALRRRRRRRTHRTANLPKRVAPETGGNTWRTQA